MTLVVVPHEKADDGHRNQHGSQQEPDQHITAAATAFIAGAEPRPVRQRYEQAITDAAVALTRASSGLTDEPMQELLGRINSELAIYTREQAGFHFAGWFSFRPLWQEISRSYPDLFD